MDRNRNRCGGRASVLGKDLANAAGREGAVFTRLVLPGKAALPVFGCFGLIVPGKVRLLQPVNPGFHMSPALLSCLPGMPKQMVGPTREVGPTPFPTNPLRLGRVPADRACIPTVSS